MNGLQNPGGLTWPRFLTVVVPIVCGTALAVLTCAHPVAMPCLVVAAVLGVWILLRSYRGAIAFVVSVLFLQFDGPLMALPVLATGSAALELLRGRSMKKLLCPQFFLLLAHLALCLIHSALAGTLLRSDLMALIKMTMLFIAAAAALSSSNMVRRTVMFFVVVGTVIACFSISVYIIKGFTFIEPGATGVSSLPPPPAGSGSVLTRVFAPHLFRRDDLFAHVMMLPTILGVVMFSRSSSRREWLGWGVCAGTMVIVMILARSRTAYVALAAVAVLAALGRSTWQQKKRILIASLLVIPFVPWRVVIPRALSVLTQTMGTNLDYSWMLRLTLWKVSLNAFLSHPLFGVGAWYTYHTTDPAILNLTAGEANIPLAFLSHSVYLSIAATSGLLGLALYGAAIASTVWDFRVGRRIYSDLKMTEMAHITRGLQFALIACLIGELAQPYTSSNYLFWILAAFSKMIRNAAEEEKESFSGLAADSEEVQLRAPGRLQGAVAVP